MAKFAMTNVVWYDGQDAYVSKFIIKVDRINPTDDWMPTVESTGFVGQYLSGNGEILKYDVLHTMEFDNIVALENYKDSKYENEIEQYAAYCRFKEMYF